jgi:hypothetical protein
MNPEQLRRALEQLHDELSRAPQLDDAARRLLREVVGDANRLDRPKGTASPHAHRLEAVAVGFEAEHPTLAAALRQLIDLLGKAGV